MPTAAQIETIKDLVERRMNEHVGRCKSFEDSKRKEDKAEFGNYARALIEAKKGEDILSVDPQ